MRATYAIDVDTVDPSADILESSGILLPGNWTSAWPEVQRSLWQKSKILLALDFDGVAVPSVDGMIGTALPPDLNHLLLKLQASPRIVLAFLSGRSVSELRSKTALENAIFAGNHGTEIEGGGLSRTDGLAASCRSDLVDVLSCLKRYVRRLPGIAVEDNGLSLTVHGTIGESSERLKAADLLNALVHRRPRLYLSERPEGWDVRVRASWDKGHAIGQIIDHLRIPACSMVYLTGAETDECALSNLAASHTFAVGNVEVSTAKYRLSTRLDMMQFLLCVLCLVNEVSLT